jgi:hypothetical protein
MRVTPWSSRFWARVDGLQEVATGERLVEVPHKPTSEEGHVCLE